MHSLRLSLLSLAASLTSFSALADEPPAPAKIPSGIRHDALTALLQKYVNAQGLVAYKEWKANAEDMKALDGYLGQFAPQPAQPAQGDELTASAINAYNAFTIRWILSNYPTESIQALQDSFKAKRHDVGGEKVSLDQIEHGTLRPQIGWRAHSALVCAARSCPPLQRTAFTPEQVKQQIDVAYTEWLARDDLNRFLPDKKKVEVSSIFKWFKEDFEKAGGIKKLLGIYAPPAHKEFAKKGDYEVDYMKYHWGLNDQGGQGKDYTRGDFLWDQITGTFK